MIYRALMLQRGLVAAGVLGVFLVATTGQTAIGQVLEHPDRPGAAQPLEQRTISLDQAHVVLIAASQRAEEIGTPMNIAIVDTGANLKTFARMDEAWLGSIDIAIRKARTARFFDMPTGDIGELSQPGGPLYMIEVSNEGLITFPGGLPIHDENGTVIGAIGVSGGSVEEDHDVASAGVEALNGQQVE